VVARKKISSKNLQIPFDYHWPFRDLVHYKQ